MVFWIVPADPDGDCHEIEIGWPGTFGQSRTIEAPGRGQIRPVSLSDPPPVGIGDHAHTPDSSLHTPSFLLTVVE